MYRCLDCKNIYKEKVEYCECGNNLFEELPEISQIEESAQVDTSSESNDDVFYRQSMIPLQLVSIIVFSICCIISLCFVVFWNPESKEPEKVPTTTQKVVNIDITSIDKIWDDTPAYKVAPDPYADFNSYKNGLKNALLKKLEGDSLDWSGSCEIEFRLDRHGNLKKKKLYQNTANKPLIDSAKRMLSSLKSYNPPPQSYDGMPITLEFVNSGSSYQLNYKN